MRLRVHHRTTYRYTAPVRFNPHRMMFRPRDSHDLRLIQTRIKVTPKAEIAYMHDVFGNSIAVATFHELADTLEFVSEIDLEHYGISRVALPLTHYAETYPFTYAIEELPDLARLIEVAYPDPDHLVPIWAKSVLAGLDRTGLESTMGVVQALSLAVHDSLTYKARPDEGTQPPAETLTRRTGSCRDYALLLMEAARSLGFAARFVSGYLYDQVADEGLTGGGATHAWAQIYLPGPGWIELDPTNALVGGKNLIRVAVARDPSQALPLTGSFDAATGDAAGMEVDVRVEKI